MTALDMQRPGAWRRLFPHALELMAELEARVPGIVWTFGGGTVLMLRIGHRLSKDIDLFVPDPQALGWINPRLSALAETLSPDYEEASEFIKLFLPDGEIDVIASPPLTERPFDIISHEGRTLRLETCGEILAKKMWHRGDRANARDLYDLCAVDVAEPSAIESARPWFARHRAAFLSGLVENADVTRLQFDQIDAIGTALDFDLCMHRAPSILAPG